ncbi:MAG: hypothetical protein WKF82_04185 [Nocardioidaceae bacterium]
MQGAAYLRESLLRAQGANDSYAAGRAFINLAYLLTTSDPVAAAEAARAAAEYARRIGDQFMLGFAQGNLLDALLLIGEWDEAEQVCDTAVNDFGLGENPNIAQAALLLRVPRRPLWSRRVASVGAAVGWYRRPAGPFSGRNGSRLGGSLCGDFANALSHAQRCLSHADANGLGGATIWGWPIAADAALALGDDTEAARLLEWLDDYPPGHIPPVLRAERLRIRARLQGAQFDPDAGAAFDAATQGRSASSGRRTISPSDCSTRPSIYPLPVMPRRRNNSPPRPRSSPSGLARNRC